MKERQIYTFGCKVNQTESDKIQNILSRYKSENILLVNTCTLTEKSDAKCRNLINRLVRENAGNEKIIVITGCLVERNYEDLTKKYSQKNLVFVKNSDKFQIQEILALQKLEDINLDDNSNKICVDRTRAFLKIQDGCDSFCSYCIVPYVRTKKWSLPIFEIESEVGKFLRAGFKEIVLTGVRIGFYEFVDDTGKIWRFEDVLEKIAKNENLKRLRISSIEPTELTEKIIDAIAKNQNICPHLHIAFQSCDDEILEAMNRNYDTFYLKNLVETLRRTIKDLRITIDLIIGFPGETDKNFENTMKFLDEMRIDGIHVFPFSAREGTKAFNLENKVPSNLMQKRKKIVQKLDLVLRRKSLEKYVGKKLEVLFETENKDGLISGYTKNYMKVFVPYEKSLENSLKSVKLQTIEENATTVFAFKGEI